MECDWWFYLGGDQEPATELGMAGRIHNGHMSAGEPEYPVAAQSKELEAPEQRGSKMQASSRLKAWKLCEELLVWVNTQRMKKWESDVHRWWQ